VLALDGQVQAPHRVLLRSLLAQIDHLDQAITDLSTEIEQRLQPYAEALDLLCTIAGVTTRVAEIVIAEIGTDMSRFPSARHLCAWAARWPGDDESAGKRRSGRTRHRVPACGCGWLRTGLVQAAWAAIRVKDSYFGAQFRRIAKRRGETRALSAG
jgi:transposase